MKKAETRQVVIPAGRRPQASDSQEQKKRPRIAETLTQITSFEACGGLIFSTMTSSVTSHSAKATPPVWVRPVRQPATMLRGYLNNSSQRVRSTGGRIVGNAIVAGST